MKIGVFGGAFNPIHNGHLNLASVYLNELNLDKILFVPTHKPPHKGDSELVSGEDRINMINLALEDSRYELCTIEFDREDKSYTYETLLELKKIYPNDSLYLIIGADQFLHFDKWYNYNLILDMVTICTFARENDNEKQQIVNYAKEKCIDNYVLIDAPVYKVSSTEIRNMFKSNRVPNGLLPEAVINYILDKGIYCE